MKSFQVVYCILSTVLFLGAPCVRGVTVNRVQELSDDYSVSWTADLEGETIVFEVKAKTKGFVGFGLSPQGGMNNADIVIGGVKDGKSYFDDRFATGKKLPKIDEKQNWKLLDASENDTYTVLKFSRDLSTCDYEDLPINSDTTNFIWSIGKSDDVSEGHVKRGTAAVNILDPVPPVVDTSKFDVWHINVSTVMPDADTTYWCTAHKSPPTYTSKRHIVGFRVKLDNEKALAHNHHLILHHCVSSPSLVDFYEGYINKPGGPCYEEYMSDMMRKCESFTYVWAKGGEPLLLPTNIGLPLTENGEAEYFLLEIHYDNPKELKGVQYNTGLEVYTTTTHREEEAGVLMVGQASTYTLMIPPATPEYTVVGHCSSDCTTNEIPEGGINVFNVLLHSHLAGRKLKVRHIRAGAELPWLSYDNHYDFNYQQNRFLQEYRKIMPGDQIAFECVDSSDHLHPPSAVLGGLTTRHEMCETFFMYYPRMRNLDVCASFWMDTEKLFPFLNIESVDVQPDMTDAVITSPAKFAGIRYSDYVSNNVTWTPDLRAKIQNMTRNEPHRAICVSYSELPPESFSAQRSSFMNAPFNDDVAYPKDFVEYAPPKDTCGGSATIMSTSFSTFLLLSVWSALCLSLVRP